MFGTTTQTSTNYHQHVQHHASATTTSTSSVSGTKSSLLSQRQSIGVAVFPGAMQRNFLKERQKLRSVGDSSQDLDSGSGNDSGTGGGHISLAAKNSSASGGEMSDSQRSLSEGRLIDSDYSRDGLSQSHDSVFSESATASSLSIVLKAELADVLRKRRNRPDASDEDLGLPRSPASPQRRIVAKSSGVVGSSSLLTKQTMEKQSEVSSLSLLSMNSADGEEIMTTSTANNSMATEMVQERSRYSRSSTMSSISVTSDILRHRDMSEAKDEVDLFSSDWQRLSHSAAKHKMAIRPPKKKGGPSRQHRRTLETSIPEANEDLNKFANKKLMDVKELDAKAKTRSLPPGVNAAKLMEEHGSGVSVKTTAFKESNLTMTTSTTTKATKYSASSTPITSNQTNTTSISAAPAAATTTTSSSNSIFGFRSLTAKASAMFESKETATEELTNKKTEVLKKPEPVTDKNETVLETQESGFLRRLMHRNSKRSIAKANAGDDDADVGDAKQNEPKKLYTSSMATEAKTYSSSSFIQDVTQSEFSYISSTEEKHREHKNEFKSESRSAFSPMAGNFLTAPSMTSTTVLTAKDDKKPEELSPSKPKSGPAARQRYLPQNISNESLPSSGNDALLSTSKESVLSKSSGNEVFQSTSIIREITKQQNTSPSKPEHHYEKKAKIVGLSAFQQKISKSNDSFGRNSSTNTSLVSLEEAEGELLPPVRVQIYEQKSRKSVEKSKSFRAYGDDKPSIPTVHNNMPSLPDLSLNLRVPYYKEFTLNETEYLSPSPPEPVDEKHTSLGFEINDNKLIKPEREHRKSFSNYDKNVVLTTTTGPQLTSKSTSQKLIAPPISLGPPLSPSAACNRNISEIESNIDMLMTSPFISVIRKSSNFSEEQQSSRVETTVTAERVRPTVLLLKKEKSLSEDNVLNSPSTANVTLREKALHKQNILYASSSGSLEPSKDTERKSAPTPATANTNGFRNNSTRRSSSVVETVQDPKPAVPEFMKIQLNRVDPMRLSKSHVVLAKNMKETPSIAIPNKSRESSPEKDDDFRRLSSESVDINERSSPEFEKRFTAVYHEAINKQAKLCIGLPPKSPLRKTMAIMSPALPATPTTPPTPTINERDPRQEPELHFKLPDTKATTTVDNSNTNSNSLSLQERRRLFMSEDKTKVEKKVEEIKYERKRSINEEICRKSVMKSESIEQKDSPTENGVVLRKKSFASSTSHLSMNGNAMITNSSTSINSNGNVSTDPTPELMKVFARRSLKVKDEDLDKMLNTSGVNNNINSSSTTASAPQTMKKFTSTSSTPSVDSDKENQSASEEKLDKLPKMDTEQGITISKISASQTHGNHSSSNGNSANSQRNSLADFRHVPAKVSTPGLSLNNNNNNNNNNNTSTNNNNNNSPVNGNKSFLPPIKIAGFRHVSMERINNNNNSNNNSCLTSPTKSTTLERPSLKLADLGSPTKTDSSTTIISKTIERSATVGEFKGIHQRRAEWEQRAKEALK